MAVFTWVAEGSTTGTFDVVTRSSSFVASYQIDTRSGSYPIENQVVLRSGEVTLYQSSGYRTSPITASDIVLEQGILSYIIDSPFKNNFYNTALYNKVVALSFSGFSLFSGFTGDILVTFNPAEDTCLYNISGSVGQKFIKSTWNGSGLISFDTSISASEIFAPVNTGSTTYVFYGEGSIASGDTTAFQSNTRVAFIPLNTILIFNTNAFTAIAMQYAGKSPTTPFGGLEIIFEELEANAPPQQFKYSNSSTVKHNKLFTWVATASDITITGTAVERNTEKYVVSGLLSTGFSAEAKVIFNPPDSTQLFNVSGSATAIASQLPKIYEGSGSLFSDGFFSNLKVRFNPLEDTALFNITGEHGTKVFVPNWRSSGTIPISGTVAPSFVRNRISSGSITTSASGTAKVVYKPATDIQLFDTSGTALIKFRQLFRDTSSGTIQLDGSATDIKQTYRRGGSGTISLTGTITPPIFVPNWRTTGTATFSGAGSRRIEYKFIGNPPSAYIDPYQVVFGEEENYETVTTKRFNTSGTAVVKFEPLFIYPGSGTIQIDGSATDIKQTYRRGGSGSISLTGTIAPTIFVPNWRTTGSISTGATGTAKVIFTPVTDTQLFDTSGTALIKFRQLFRDTSSGTIQLDGSATDIKQRYKTSGSGSISLTGTITPPIFVPNWRTTGTATFSGAGSRRIEYNFTGNSPSAYIDPYQVVFGEEENYETITTKRFNTSGTAVVIYDPLFIHYGSGTIQLDGSATDIKQTYRTSGSGSISLTGTITSPIFVPNWRSTGTVSTGASGTAKVIFTPVTDIQLFDTSGTALIKFRQLFRDSGSGTIQIDGSADLKQTQKTIVSGSISVTGTLAPTIFVPNWRTTGTATFSGTAVEKQIEVASGSGSLFSSASGSAKVTFTPITDTQLFDTSGTALIKFRQLFRDSGSGTIEIGGESGIVFIRGAYIYEGSGIVSQINGAASATRTSSWIGLSPLTYFSAGQIVFEDDENFGASDFKYGSTATHRLHSNFAFSGSGTLPALTSTVEQISTTQYLQRTNVLSDTTEYTRVNLSSLLQVSGIPNPITGIINSPTAIYNAVASSNGGAPDFLAGYITPVSSTGTFAAGTVSVLSIFAKANTWNKFSLLAYSTIFGSSDALPNHEVRFDLNAGTATNLQGTNPPLNYGIIPYENGWYRCWIKVKSRISSNQNVPGGWFQFRFSSDSVAGSSIYWYGPQLQKNNLTSYVENISSATALTTTAFIEVDDESVGFNPPEANQLFSLSGSAIEKQTDIAPPGSGSLFSSGFFSNLKVTFNPPEDTQLFSLSGQHGTRVFVPNWISTGTVSTGASGTAKVAYKPVTDIQLFDTSGTALIKFRQLFRDSGSGTIQIDGSSDFKQTQKTIVSGSISVTGTLAPTIFVPNWRTTGSISTGASGTAKVAYKPVTDIQLFDTSGTAVVKFRQLFRDSGSGTIQIDGSATDIKQTYRRGGSGSISVTGTSVENHTDITSGSGSIITGSYHVIAQKIITPDSPEINTSSFVYVGISNSGTGTGATGGFNIGRHLKFGTTQTHPTNTERRFDLVALDTVTFTSLSVDVIKGTDTNGGEDPEVGEELQLLYSIDQGNTFTPINANSGIIVPHFTAVAHDFSSLNTVTIQLPEEAKTSSTIFRFRQATASSNVADHYGITEIRSNSITPLKIVSASFRPFDATDTDALFTVLGSYSSVKFISQAGESPILFGASGNAVTRPPNRHIGSGTATLSGSATEKQTDIAPPGSGSLFSSGFFSNLKVTFNPPEGNQLFDITGQHGTRVFVPNWISTGTISINGTAVEKQIEVATGSGTATLSGSATEKQTDIAPPGSGSLFASASGSAKVTFNPPEDTQLFSLSGQHGTRVFVPNWRSSGSLFTAFGGTASITFNPPDSIQLFDVTGAVSQAQRNVALPGSGSLFASASGSAKVTFNPPEDTQLFVVTGAVSQAQRNVALPGSGSLFTAFGGTASITFNPPDSIQLFDVSGFVIEKQTNITFGSGSLFASASGSAKVTFNPPEDTQLFEVSGTYSNLKFISANNVSGTATFSGTAVEKQINVVIGSGTATFSGTAVEKQTNIAPPGSGSLFTAFGGTASITFNPPEDTQLFDVSGEVYAITTIKYEGEVFNITGSGEAIFRRALVPQTELGEIISSGESITKNVLSYVGSGLLVTASGSAEATTNVPLIDIILYRIRGSASVSRAVIIDNNITININGVGRIRTAFQEEIFATII